MIPCLTWKCGQNLSLRANLGTTVYPLSGISFALQTVNMHGRSYWALPVGDAGAAYRAGQLV